MEIPVKKIGELMKRHLKQMSKKIKKRKGLLLTAFSVGNNPQLSSIRIRSKTAKELGIEFEVCKLTDNPSFETLMNKIKEKNADPKVNGVIIQQPIPAHLSTESMFDYIDLEKEIEGHRRKTPFLPPLGLAVMTILKYVFTQKISINNPFFDPKKDFSFIKKVFKNKKVVFIHTGIPNNLIGKTLTDFKINYIGITPQTPEPESYYKEADVIIWTTPEINFKPEFIKPGSVLINASISTEPDKNAEKLANDKAIRKNSGWYIEFDNGVRVIETYCLFRNLFQALKLQ